MNILRKLDQEDRSVTGTIATTYTFGPRFFESQILDACADRHSGRNTVVLVDSDTYAETTKSPDSEDNDLRISDRPKAAGSRYYLAPVDSGPSTFHPKIVYQAGEKRANAFIGSANLTQQGYTSNREVVTAVSVEAETDNLRTANLLKDCRSYFVQLRQHSAATEWGEIVTDRYQTVLDDSNWLTDYSDAAQDTWFLHNLNTPLLDQIRTRIQENGDQITAVDIIAPFYGTSLAVPREFTGDGIETTLHLQDGDTQIDIEELEEWLDSPVSHAATLNADRYVHGKVLLFRTESGCYCFSGSANGSRSALLTTAGSPKSTVGNHEAGVLRRVDNHSQYEYLLDGEKIYTTDDFDVNAFTPGVLTEFDDRQESTTDEHSSILSAPIVSVYQRAHSGARIIVEVTINTEQIDPQRSELSLEIDRIDSGESTTLTLYPADRSRRDIDLEAQTVDDSHQRLRYSKPTHRNQIRRLVKGGCRVRLAVETASGEEVKSGFRWIETSPPDDTEETGKATERAGTDTVPQSMSDLFLLDDIERREGILTSINGVIAGLREGTADIASEGKKNQNTKRREGIRVRNWDSASTSSDPSSAIITFYNEWMEDMTELSEVKTDPDGAFDAVAARLRAINQCNIQLEALGRADGHEDIPSHLPTEITNRLYTRQEYGQLGSRLHWFLTRGRDAAEGAESDGTSITVETIYSWCQEDILPNIIVGALIAEHQLASSTEEYHRYFGSSFEQLASDCFTDEVSFAHWATTESVDLTLVTIGEIIEPVVDQLDRHGYAKELPYVFRDTNRLEDASLRVLGRALAKAGGTEVYKTVSDRNQKLLQFALNSERR